MDIRNPVPKNNDRREPIFGIGAGSFFAQLLMLAGALCLLLAVLFLGVFVKDETRHFLYGEQSHTQPTLEPGQSTVIDGVKIKRIN